MTNTTVLSASGLTKRFGKQTAVNQLSFSIQKGNVFGLLGPNGSGKSTTLGMLLGVLQPDAGTFQWFGGQQPTDARRNIGTLLEQPNFYPYLTALQNLKVSATIKEVTFNEIEVCLKAVNLWQWKDKKFRTFSTGMKQRLAIAAALLGDPDLLILDEPTNGLDPQGIAEVRELIKKESESGRTIILASHLLDEVEKVCTHVAVLQKGNLLYTGEVDALTGSQKRIEVGAADKAALEAALKANEMIEKITSVEGYFVVSVKPAYSAESLNRYLFEKGIVVQHLSAQKHSLEMKFLELTTSAS